MTQALKSSPHLQGSNNITKTMAYVLLACAPAYAAATWFFGWGLTINIVLCMGAALASEALIMRIRQRSITESLSDGSALVTALLLAFTIPPGAPWWIPILGAMLAITIGKQVYGGIGLNIFNPAMVGYAALLTAFPLQMTGWQLPNVLTIDYEWFSPLSWDAFLISINLTFPFLSLTQDIGLDHEIDGFAKATPLLFHKLAAHSAIAGQWTEQASLFDRSSDVGWEWINLGFLCGGLFLLFKRIITWHIPVSLIVTVLALSFYFYQPGSEAVYGSPYLHLFGTATMIGAFFIATDPVSSPASPAGKIIYGILLGIFIYCIRVWGSYLDSIAFSVLLANGITPLLDYGLRPRIFGETPRSFWRDKLSRKGEQA
ncbi:MAG: RnfABCDGE type electron transport complex subunit D [Pseudohongiellaceae bacterium]|nr:RnfABCDGE type electron transport complex subunit D [Pseudohongiellaceae bacterium]